MLLKPEPIFKAFDYIKNISKNPYTIITEPWGKRESVNERDKSEILRRFKDYILESKLYPEENIPEEEVRLLTKAAYYAISKC
jgi:tRNA G37 N-methylase TrmD